MIKVVKIGGNVVENEELLKGFCADFVRMEGPKVLIHGGGVMASDLQKQLGQQPVMIEGRRVTDSDALKAVTMVYSGWCNKHIVATLQYLGCNAIGLSGCDGNVVAASRRAPRTLSDGITKVDYGFVGDVTPSSVNVPLLNALVEAGMVPVLCAINHDGQGNLLNTNADTISSSVAAALKGSLLACFELDGVLADKNDPESVVRSLNSEDFDRMVADGVIAGGMIPKVRNCLDAIAGGAESARILNSKALLDPDAGTAVTR